MEHEDLRDKPFVEKKTTGEVSTMLWKYKIRHIASGAKEERSSLKDFFII